MADDAIPHADVLNSTAQGQLKSIVERVERLLPGLVRSVEALLCRGLELRAAKRLKAVLLHCCFP